MYIYHSCTEWVPWDHLHETWSKDVLAQFRTPHNVVQESVCITTMLVVVIGLKTNTRQVIFIDTNSPVPLLFRCTAKPLASVNKGAKSIFWLIFLFSLTLNRKYWILAFVRKPLGVPKLAAQGLMYRLVAVWSDCTSGATATRFKNVCSDQNDCCSNKWSETRSVWAWMRMCTLLGCVCGYSLDRRWKSQ